MTETKSSEALTTAAAAETVCAHCGTRCSTGVFTRGEDAFCCQGCLLVFELLTANGLAHFYELAPAAGVRIGESEKPAKRFSFLDDPEVRRQLVDYSDERRTNVTFRLPAIHCIGCVWLLENLFRLNPGIGLSRVHFPRKEVAISFDPKLVKFSEVAGLLSRLGYEPDLKLADLDEARRPVIERRLLLQIGLAGFAFGNIMLLSIASYLGLDSWSGETFKKLSGIISLGLAVPVVVFSAADYWSGAWRSLRQRMLPIEVPIAVGIAAIVGQSTYEVLTGRGEGYFDSLTGLIFFLLCGKLFQQRTYDRLAFDRDYKSFFPLSVTRMNGSEATVVSLSQLRPGDQLLIRNGELIPADSRLAEGQGRIDYSFVTGESEPVEKTLGDYLYAGGRQAGPAITVEMVKPVSQSYLTSLWNQDAFVKQGADTLDDLTNRYSRRFSKLVLGIALGAAAFWFWRDASVSVRAFTAVLIVACPCALALAAPFTLGAALRALGRRDIFVKNGHALERLAQVDAIVFDKTGTLTDPGPSAARFAGWQLSEAEEIWALSLARHSTHPLAASIARSFASATPKPVERFAETIGGGMAGEVEGHTVRIGSLPWLALNGVRELPEKESSHRASSAHLAIDGTYRGEFILASSLRPQLQMLIQRLKPNYELALLSGDSDKDAARFHALFGPGTEVRFSQSPLDKLHFVRHLQNQGKKVLMVGDGLNDAGALKQSSVGLAVVENISAFSPASDIILPAEALPQLDRILRFSKRTVSVVRWSFGISSLYNVVGISIAAAGLLAPIVCAILMPASSITVVAFACGVTQWLAGRTLRDPNAGPSSPGASYSSTPGGINR